MVSKLCCGLGSFFKHQGRYYPRRTEAAPDLIEQTNWQESKHEEAEYPYEWLKSASTKNTGNGRGRRRRFLSRIRSIHALDDSGIAEDFIFNSIATTEDLSGKEHAVTGPAEVTEDTKFNDGTDKSRTKGIDNIDVEDTKDLDTQIASDLKDATVDAKELSHLTSPKKQINEQTLEGKQNAPEKDTSSSSERFHIDETKIKRLLEDQRRCANTESSLVTMPSPCSASAPGKSPTVNTQKDTSSDQDASTADDQTHHLEEQRSNAEGTPREDVEQPAIAERENVRDHDRLDMERQEQRMQDWIRQNRSTTRIGQRSLQLLDRTAERLTQPTQQRPNEDQPSQPLRNDQVVDQDSSHRRPQQPLQQHRPGNRRERREQGDRWHEREGERRQRQRDHIRALGLGGEVASMRSNAERDRENLVRELRQQAHRGYHREGYVSMVGAIVRQRHSQHGHYDGLFDSQPIDQPRPPPPPPPPELERRVRNSEIERVQRLNPHPPRRRRRYQKRPVFQPKKECE